MFKLIQNLTLKPSMLDLFVINLWNIIEMYIMKNFIQYLSQWCCMVMFNWVYIASRIELLSESSKLSANIVKTEIQRYLIRNAYIYLELLVSGR